MNKDKAWIYDIESYPNFFLLSAKNPFTGDRRRFQISQIADNRVELATWLLNDVEDMIGFNNLFYDYPVLEYLITKCMKMRGSQATGSIFKFGHKRINSGGFSKQSNFLRNQIDLFKINHFDNKAKLTSLKLLEFNLRLDNIEELPYPVGTTLTKEQAYKVISYCDNDVDATEKLFFKTLPAIELRQVLSPKYNIDFTNFNDVKVGEHIFISKIIIKGGEHLVYDTVEKENGSIRKIVKNTTRASINIGDTLLPFITFREEPFQKILEWFRNKTIKELNGVFSTLPFEDLVSLEPHYRVVKTKGRQKTLNILYKGFQYDFGVGGIHGSIDSGVYTPEDDELIIDIDVEGYYPSMSVQFKFEPEHLKGIYSDIHKEIKAERALYPKKTPENTSMKLAGNGTYGKGGSEFSPLCDKQYVVQTCVNGQLLLCMLAETLTIELSFHQMIQINTDGMTIRIKKSEYELFQSIYHRWERLTGLKLEEASYSKMVISNVNNYLAIYTDGKVKRKGTYEYDLENTLHKNFSMLVVPKALEAYFVNNIPVDTFVRNHTDYYDFFKRTKINKTDKLLERVYDQHLNVVSETEIQRINRYLVTGKILYDKKTRLTSYIRKGVSLIKEMPPLKGKDTLRNTNMEAGFLSTSVNKMIPDEQIKQLIYYPYYINEVDKIIKEIEHER